MYKCLRCGRLFESSEEALDHYVEEHWDCEREGNEKESVYSYVDEVREG